MGLIEVKEEAVGNGFTKICLDAEGAHPVSLIHWNGVSPYVESGPGDINMASVDYAIDGNKVHVRKTFGGNFSYTLS
jgi:hypothetical protein